MQGANEAANNRIPPSNRSKVKSSVQRGLRQKLLDTYPGFEPYIEEIMPKKASLEAVKLYVSPPIPIYLPVPFPTTYLYTRYNTTKLTHSTPQPGTYNPVHNRFNTTFLPTLRRPANPTPQAHPRLP